MFNWIQSRLPEIAALAFVGVAGYLFYGPIYSVVVLQSGWIALALVAGFFLAPAAWKAPVIAALANPVARLVAGLVAVLAVWWFFGPMGVAYAVAAAAVLAFASRFPIVEAFAEAFPARLERAFRKSDTYLLAGDREAYARANWPEAQWPTLYKSVPADIVRPVEMMGRLYGGRDVAWLAYHHFNDEVVQDAAVESGQVAYRIAVTVFVGLLAAIVYSNAGAYGYGSLEYPAWAEEVGAIGPIVGYWVLYGIEAVLSGITGFAFAAAAAVLVFIAAWFFGFWSSLKAWWTRAQAPLSTPTRDAKIIWQAHPVERRIAYEAYSRQVDTSTGRLALSPLVPVGIATGLLRSLGDSTSYMAGQLAAQDGASIWQHTAIFGGTGSGKTFLAIGPRIGRLTRAFAGSGEPLGFLVLDGKGTLWSKDYIKEAFKDRTDVATIGVRDDHYGFDLLKGMSPQQVAETFENVASQLEGKPSGDFWLKSASQTAKRGAAIARVLPDDTFPGVRPYTLLGIGMIVSDKEARARAIDIVADLIDKAGGMENATDELREAAEAALFMQGEGWDKMAEATRTGILANLNVVLGQVSNINEASRRFFRGQGSKMVGVEHVLDGGVLMNAMGEAEHGAAGKIIAIWIKERLYTEAMKRLAVYDAAVDSGEKPAPMASVAVIMDEAQALLSQADLNFWPMSREAKIFLTMATQSLSSINATLGVENATKLMDLMTTKLCLKTSDKATIEYFAERGGSFPFAYDATGNLYATQAQREAAVPDVAPSFRPAGLLSFLLPTAPELAVNGMSSVVAYDGRFVKGTKRDSEGDGGAAAAAWRFEDKNKEALTSGLAKRPAIDLLDLRTGQGFALAIIERADSSRVDIVDLKALIDAEQKEAA